MPERNGHDDRGEETTYSGEVGERSRNTPARTPAELGLGGDWKRGSSSRSARASLPQKRRYCAFAREPGVSCCGIRWSEP